MRRVSVLVLPFVLLMVVAVALRASVQDRPGGPPPRQGEGGQRGGPGGPGGPVGYHLLPRFAVEKLNLTEDQMKSVVELEKDVKAKLYKILTPEQQKILEEARPPRPGQGGGRPEGGADRRGREGGGAGGDKPSRSQRPPQE